MQMVASHIYVDGNGLFFIIKPIYIYILFQFCSCHLAVTHKPHLTFRVPFCTSCLGLVPYWHIGSGNTQGNDRNVREAGWRRSPVIPLYDEFNGLDSLLVFCIVAESDTDQRIAVFTYKPFGAVLPRFQRQSCFHFVASKYPLAMKICCQTIRIL